MTALTISVRTQHSLDQGEGICYSCRKYLKDVHMLDTVKGKGISRMKCNLGSWSTLPSGVGDNNH